MGMIDHSGRIIDQAKNRSKLFIIEQEFKQAEKAEYMRKKEEQEMRRRVQKKRREMFEKARLAERLAKMKEDRRIRKEILAIASPYHAAIMSPSNSPSSKAPSKKKKSKEESSFFLTEEMRVSKLNDVDIEEGFL